MLILMLNFLNYLNSRLVQESTTCSWAQTSVRLITTCGSTFKSPTWPRALRTRSTLRAARSQIVSSISVSAPRYRRNKKETHRKRSIVINFHVMVPLVFFILFNFARLFDQYRILLCARVLLPAGWKCGTPQPWRLTAFLVLSVQDKAALSFFFLLLYAEEVGYLY